MDYGVLLSNYERTAPRGKAEGGARPSQQHRLYACLRTAILSGQIEEGTRLASSRSLAEELGMARNSVLYAYEQLAAEGFVLSRRQGTVVARVGLQQAPTQAPEAPPALSHRVAGLARPSGEMSDLLPFLPGTPALDAFPLAQWRRCMERAWRHIGPAQMGYGQVEGNVALRQAVAEYLRVSRGVRCEAAQVFITDGTQNSLDLCARALADAGDIAWIENPGYYGARASMQAADLRLVPIGIDADGLAPRPEDWRDTPPKLIYITPSHQYPLGSVMSLERRLALIQQARAVGAWIIEDDYDSEFRHAGESIGALQGLVPQAPVLYVGTFSKTLFPSLRLGFLVLPEALLPGLQGPLGELLRGGQRHSQLALAQFMESGEFARHLGRMRRLYRSRQSALRSALQQHLGVPHQIEGGQCGLHLCVRFGPRWPDQAVAEQARQQGMAPSALSGFALPPRPPDNGLVLGYGNTSSELFAPLIQRLSRLMQAL